MRAWILALLLSLTVGCAVVAQPARDSNALSSPAATRQDSALYDYRLGAGDKVRIIVFGEESLSGEFLVPGGTGEIAFPLVGDVQAAGLTVTELQGELEAKLRDGYLKQPAVSIEVLNYRPFYIMGEVGKSGEYPYTNGLTVLNAVATAGGFTYRADKSKVFIRRAGETKEESSKLTTTTPVEPGDTIRIAERYF
ncbi:MAG TPA: polysaccharide biosynthesis/export family protein [Caulobacteraceae bacterium]|jgi:polysaccharide export outer membrane protein